MTDEICPICGIGHLECKHDYKGIYYLGDMSILETVYSTCDHCGCEEASADQVAFNKKAMLNLKEKVMSRINSIRENVEGMTPGELLKRIESGISL